MKLLKLIQNGRKVEEITSALAWLEARDSAAHFKNGQVFVQVYEQIDGVRVRRCEGVGCCLLTAINDAAQIIRLQDSSSSLVSAATEAS